MQLPDMLTRMPRIVSPMESVQGHLIQGESNQSIFFSVKAGTRFPEHSHEAQWGVVLEGEFEITVDGQTTTYKKGDAYYVPGDTPHEGYYVTDVLSFDVFDATDRFKVQEA